MLDTYLKENVLHITACLRKPNSSVSRGWIDRFKRRDNIVYRTLLGESTIVNSETAEDCKNTSYCKKLI
jgi:hypothetical protein